LAAGEPAPMAFESYENGKAVYKGSIPLEESGRYGFSIRAMPSNPDLFDRIEPGFVCWR